MIETNPAGARIRLQRYTEDARGRRQLGQDEELGRTPLRDVSLKEGSYLLSVTLQERTPISYPVLLRSAERHHIALDLPARAALPEGFLYIPRGRFLFGTSADESVRQGFLSTVPVHEVESGAYIIGRSEVTYAEWVQFLESLPPAERAQHTIHVPKGGIGGGVELQEVGDRSWRLMLQPVSQAHRARTGEALVYPSRKLRREQDWLRLPVSGIGPADVRAYAAWLDRSGRVPGARLCSEKEWERAARGADDREYPHGTALASDEANFDETYGKDLSSAGPDAAGSYPDSVSPFGLLDMAGNVFEWADSSLVPGEVVARGGGYFMGAIAARSTNRTPLDPGFRDPAVGARICASYPLRSRRE
jgi:formylglycine-generating enzyme required for sulfatase activity